MSGTTSLLVLGLGGLAAAIAAIAISGIIVLVVSEAALLTYRRLFGRRASQ